MKKLILPLLFIFLAAAAFGQTKKEMPQTKIAAKNVVRAKDLKEVKLVKLSPKLSKHATAAFEKEPSLSKYWKIDQKTLKPKAGYGFLSNGKGQVVTCRTGANGKPKLQKARVIHTDNDDGSSDTFICRCKEPMEDGPDPCDFRPVENRDVECSGVGCECQETWIITDSNGVTKVITM